MCMYHVCDLAESDLFWIYPEKEVAVLVLKVLSMPNINDEALPLKAGVICMLLKSTTRSDSGNVPDDQGAAEFTSKLVNEPLVLL